MRDVGITLAQVIDKMRLLREQPTAITETIDRSAMLERLIERTLQEFPDMTRQEVIELIGEVRPEAIKLLWQREKPPAKTSRDLKGLRG